MLNKIWPVMIIISVVFGFFNGRIAEVNNSIFVSFEDTINMGMSFLGVMCFWSGMIKILNPFIEKFFSLEDEKSKELISLNMVSNMMGIGNAATPIGIQAMKEMEKNASKKGMSHGMAMFVLMNTLSIQIIPATIISVRASLGSEKSGSIIFPVWIVSILTFFVVMIIGSKIFKKENDNEYI